MQRSGRCSCELVDATPMPILTGFVGPDDGMGGSEKALGFVPFRQSITGSEVIALLEHTHKDPVQSS